MAECAQSNYPATKLSVTSTFYTDYHKEPTLYPVSSSQTIEMVRSLGYKVITFENRSNGHFDIGEDMRLSRNRMAFGLIDMTGGLSEFDMMLLNTSILRVAIDMPQLVPGLDENMLKKTQFYEHYQQTYYILAELKRLPEMEGPKFIFAHILVPHPPFIFSADGSFDWAENGFVVGGRRLWRVDVVYAGEDTIGSAAGNRRAVVFDGTSYRARRDLSVESSRPARTFRVWLSDDADRVPLRVTAKTELGDVVMALVDYSRP